MLTTERQNAIMQLLKEKRSAGVKDIAKALYVSEATVRRDLTELKSSGLIERSHGGAILPENADEISMFVRIEKNAKEKEKVATKALKILPDFKSVFIDSSSTALALAGRMDLSFKNVVTNNLQTAMTLSKKQNVNLILLGGNVAYNTNSSTGSWTARQIQDFSFVLIISSCAGISDTEIFERSLDQKEIKLSALSRSKIKILVVDHTKFSLSATYRLSDMSNYDYVVTDEKPPERLLDKPIRFVY